MDLIGTQLMTEALILSVGIVRYCDIYLMCLDQTLGDQRCLAMGLLTFYVSIHWPALLLMSILKSLLPNPHII